MKYLVLVLFLLLFGCGNEVCPGEWSSHVVGTVLSCTGPRHGWSGGPGSCRIVMEDGRRATVMAPVAVGDKYVSKGKCVWLEGRRYAPINSGIISEKD